MAFDSSHPPMPEHRPAPRLQDEPIDYVDWAMRIVDFGPLLVLYSLWMWTALQAVLNALVG